MTQANSTLFANRPPAISRPAAPAFRAAQASQNDAWQGALAAAATAAVWIGCLVVGILGVLLPYAREHLEAKPQPIVQAVRLMPPREQASDTERRQIGPKLEPAPPPDVPAPPEAPPPLAVAVAAPGASIAFAVPVEGPTHIVDAKYAVLVAARPPALTPPVQHLRFGVGEGQQPEPEYPRDAIGAREQGTVVVRFTVGEDGRVRSADATQPCRWPLLNQAAVRTIRDLWRFSPGNVRTYDVPIQFQINEK